MHQIDEHTARRIKEAADIVAVVGSFVQLKREGENYMALCPFHEDRHMGSFVISPRKNMCSCFSCGIRYDSVAFLMNYGQGMSYPDALRWLASKFCIPIAGEEPLKLTPAQPRQPLPELPTLTMPMGWVREKLAINSKVENPLIGWLRALPWQDGEERDMLEMWLRLYGVGTSDAEATRGWTIWWQIDERNNVRTGKLMKYQADGHRDKASRYNFNFVHSMLLKAGKWSAEQYDARPCMFGLHLLDCFPEAEVCIVESEKSAIIAQTLSTPGKKLFMATGSKGSLTRVKIQPLIDRKRWIIVYPDVDGLEEWTERVKLIGYERMSVTKVVRQMYSPTLDSPKADIADILVRMLSQPRPPTQDERLELLRQQHPGLDTLLNKLPMESVELRRMQP